MLSYWEKIYPRLLMAGVYIPSAAGIDAALVGDHGAIILGLFNPLDYGVDSVRVCENAYVPPLSIPILLINGLMELLSCMSLHVMIAIDVLETTCKIIIKWINITIFCLGLGEMLPLVFL